MKSFKEAMKELRAYVLSPDKVNAKVTIIVCTVANLASPTLYRNASQAEWIITDEIPRATEPMLWLALAHYPECRFHIFIGDPEQLPPQLQSCTQNNSFAKQLRISMYTRFYFGGHVYEFFDKQHRAVSPIGKMVSSVFYAKRLINGPGTDMDHPSRDIARRIAEYNKENYSKHSPIIFLDNKDYVVKKNAVGKSSYNISNCAVGINLAVDLVMNGFDPRKITILMPYTAQRRYYLCAVRRADTMHPKLGIRKISVAVIDGYLGKENHIIILDWVVAEALSFFKERSRVCVAHSRAKDALYVIGNKTELEKNQKSDMRTFRKLLGRDALGGLRFSLPKSQSSPYVSEDVVDVATEIDMQQLTIDENKEGTAATEKTPDQVWDGAAAAGNPDFVMEKPWGRRTGKSGPDSADACSEENDAQSWAQDWENDAQDGGSDGHN
jgi:superfamily I DNA and/or RNA helicase